jgi:hypothetical protein
VGGEGRARDTKAVDFKQGPERMGICHHEHGTAFPSKVISVFLSFFL